MKFNQRVSPSGELRKSKEERGAVYPQQPPRASMDLENMHLTFDETIASSTESTSLHTPRRHRSRVNSTKERLQPVGTSAACSWSAQRRAASARSNLRGPEGRQEPCFPPLHPLALEPLTPLSQGGAQPRLMGLETIMRRNSQVCIYSNVLAPWCFCR